MVADVQHLLKMQWYYSVELSPGVVTSGQDHCGGALTREALRRINFRDRYCLDVGIQEGFFSILLCRGGAASVEAQDRFPRLKQVHALREIYDAPFTFEHGQSLDEYARARLARAARSADVILFAGILYHMFDPFAGLCRIRGLAAQSGIVVIETAAVVRPDTNRSVLYFNDNNSLSGTSTYFVPTATWLDVALRYVGFVPLDCLFIRYRGTSIAGRICVPCRVGSPPELTNMERKAWERDFVARDFGEFLDLRRLSDKTDPVEYNSAGVSVVRRADGSVDIARTVAEGEPLSATKRDVILMLSDRA